MNPVSLVTGFIPLILFGILDGPVSVGLAAVISAAVGVWAISASVRTTPGVFPAMPIVQAATLAVIAVVAYSGDHATRTFLSHYGQGIASLALAAYMLVTVMPAPFTAAYAKAEVPREEWRNPQFIRLNRQISLVWGLAILVMALSHFLAGYLQHARHAGAAWGTLINWAPTVIAIVVAVGYTRQVVNRARARAARTAEASGAPHGS